MTLKTLIDSISTFSPILPLVIGLKKRPGLVWFYILLGLVFNVVGGKVFRGTADAKMIANIYVFVEFFFVSIFFFRAFNQNQRWIVYVGCVFMLFCTYNTLTYGLKNFNFLSAAILCFFYIAYCIMGLYVTMLDTRVINVFDSFFFIVTIGLLIYFSGMFFIFSVGSYFRRHEILWGLGKYTLMGKVWIINSFCNIVQAVTFAGAFWIHGKLTTATRG